MWLMTAKATAHSGAIPSVRTLHSHFAPKAHIQATFGLLTRMHDLVHTIQADRIIVRNGVTDTNQDTIFPKPVLRYGTEL
jgi:hypothetical protein